MIPTLSLVEALAMKGRVLIDFFKLGCGPCKALESQLELLQIDHNISIVKVDANRELDACIEYGITGLPSLVYLKDGELQGTLHGFKPKEFILQWLGSMG